MNRQFWYAVLRNNEDTDWGDGSFNKRKAIKMAKEMECKEIAVIRGCYNSKGEPTTDPICVEVITDF